MKYTVETQYYAHNPLACTYSTESGLRRYFNCFTVKPNYGDVDTARWVGHVRKSLYGILMSTQHILVKISGQFQSHIGRWNVDARLEHLLRYTHKQAHLCRFPITDCQTVRL